MQPTTPAELLELLLASELLEGDRLERATAAIQQAADLNAAARALIAEGFLTRWHVAKLLEGRVKGYFLGKYRLLDQLGAGAMGSVYLGEHRVMRHRVAIKVLAKRLIGKPGYIRRFQQEARAAAAVSHPRLVRAFDVDSIGGLHFMVMEYVPGENLREIVVGNGPLPIEEAAEYTRQTAEGLAAAHRAGLIHRDIKPSNLILDDEKQVHVLDLGLARIIDDEECSVTLANDTKLIGTVDYLAPEQARDCHHIDRRADIYSLGCTLYYFLCGRPPFCDGSLTQRIIHHQTVPPPDIREFRADCPDDLTAICLKMLAKLPEDRFQSADEIVVALQAFLRNEPVHLPAAGTAVRQPVSANQLQASLAGRSDHPLPTTRPANPASRSFSSDDELGFAPDDDPQSDFADRSPPSRTTTTIPSGTTNHNTDSVKNKSKNNSQSVNNGPGKSSAGSSASSNFLDDTEPERLQGGSETFAGLMDDWNSLLDQATQSAASASQGGSLSLDSNPLGESDSLLSSHSVTLAQLPATQSTLASGSSSLNLNSQQAAGLDLQKIRDQALAFVSEKDDRSGKMTPALWFCIVAGILLGLILVGVSVSYIRSFQEKHIDGKESMEGG